MVDVRANYGTVYHCRIRKLEPGRAIEVVVKPALMTIINIYEVEPTERERGSATRSRCRDRSPRLSGSPPRRIYRRQLEEEVRAVARVAAGKEDPDITPVSQLSIPVRVRQWFGRQLRGGRERRQS